MGRNYWLCCHEGKASSKISYFYSSMNGRVANRKRMEGAGHYCK